MLYFRQPTLISMLRSTEILFRKKFNSLLFLLILIIVLLIYRRQKRASFALMSNMFTAEPPIWVTTMRN